MTNSKEGIYDVRYTNEDNISGHGTIILDTGRIIGWGNNGIKGEIWDGEYSYNKSNDTIEGKFKVIFPIVSHAQSAISGNIYKQQLGSEEILFSIPRNFNEEITFRMDIAGGKALNIIFTKIRDHPII